MASTQPGSKEQEKARGRETELVGTEQRPDDDVPARAHAAVDLHGDSAAEPIDNERLMRIGEAKLPGPTRVHGRGERARSGAAVTKKGGRKAAKKKPITKLQGDRLFS